MGVLRLYAIGVDEMRDMVGATPELAEELRLSAAPLLVPPEPTRRGFWGRFRAQKPTPPVPAPGTAEDLEILLGGRYASPDRAVRCWRWLEELVGVRSWGQTVQNLTRHQIDAFDFALAKAGVPAQTGLEQLLRSDARVALTAVPDVTVAYLPHAQVVREHELLGPLQLEDPDQAAVVRNLAGFFDQFPVWATRAAAESRPAPDLVAFWWTP